MISISNGNIAKYLYKFYLKNAFTAYTLVVNISFNSKRRRILQQIQMATQYLRIFIFLISLVFALFVSFFFEFIIFGWKLISINIQIVTYTDTQWSDHTQPHWHLLNTSKGSYTFFEQVKYYYCPSLSLYFVLSLSQQRKLFRIWCVVDVDCGWWWGFRSSGAVCRLSVLLCLDLDLIMYVTYTFCWIKATVDYSTLCSITVCF